MYILRKTWKISKIWAQVHSKLDQKGVHKLLPNVQPHKATGLVEIPTHVLKAAVDEFVPFLASLFQASLDKRSLPQDGKEAMIGPICKKGERHLAANYCPVSLTSFTCKILEHIVCSDVPLRQIQGFV